MTNLDENQIVANNGMTIFVSFIFLMQIEIDHLNNEHLESVESYYDDAPCYIQALQFKTNFKVSELIGYGKGTKFSLSVKGKIIIGFHGYIKSQNNPLVKSLGAYFTWIPDCRLEAKGSKGGIQWDDGADHEGITKIHVRGGFEGIQYIKFDYVKSGQPKIGSVHGLSGRGFSQAVCIGISHVLIIGMISNLSFLHHFLFLICFQFEMTISTMNIWYL